MKKAILALAVALLVSEASAATKYWDINGATTGAGGATPAGNWNTTTNNWTTDGTNGELAGVAWVANDAAVFSAGGDATGTFLVTTTAAMTASSILVEEGSVRHAGTSANTLTTSSVTVNNGASFGINVALSFTPPSGSVMTLNGGTVENYNTGSGGSFLSSGSANTNMKITLGTGGGHVSANGGSGIISIYTGLIDGTGPLSIDGSGIFRLTTTTATYTGATIINGTLQISTTANVLPSNTALTINSGGTLDLRNATGLTVGSLAGAGTVTSPATGGLLTVGGNNASTTFSGILNAGAATLSFVKNGTGTLTITNNDWTNTGTTTINGGVLQFGNSAAGLGNSSQVNIGASGTLDMNNFNDTVGSLVGAAGSSIINGGNLVLSGNNGSAATFSGTFSGSAASRVLTKNGAGIQILAGGTNQWTAITHNAGDLRFNAANSSGATNGSSVTITTGATAAGDVTGAAAGAGIGTSASGITLANPMSLTAGSSISIFSTSGNSITFSGKISGAGSLIRSDFGAGSVTLTGDNDFTGGLTLISRSLTLGHKNALGTNTFNIGHATQAAANAISVSASTALTGVNAVPNAITANKDFTVSGSNALEFAGTIGLTGVTRTVTTTNTGGTTFSGVISNGALTKAGTQSLTLTNSNLYAGATSVSAGTLVAASDGALGTAAAGTTVSSGATLGFQGNINYATAEAVSITGTGVGTNGAINNLSGSNSFGGALTMTGASSVGVTGQLTLNNNVGGAFALTKVGAGTLVLANAAGNSYGTAAVNSTIINGGTVYANDTTAGASATGPGNVQVNNGGTLGGTGSVAGAVIAESGGTVAPGASIESLDVGSLTFNSGSAMAYEMDTSLATAVGADLLNSAAGLTIQPDVDLTVTDANSVLSANVVYTLIRYEDGGYNGGTFDGLAEGAEFAVGYNVFRINYAQTAGGDNFGGGTPLNARYVTLTTTGATVPEASAVLFGLLAAGSAGVGLVVRRRGLRTVA